MRLLRALLLFSLCLLATPARAADRLRLRVVSINCWGLPWITPAREARMRALGPALLELKPDVVLLQEVWLHEDGQALMAALKEGGLPHAVHFDQGFLGSGLLIASAFPITRSQVDAFELAGKPHKPYHGDWYARKGVAQAVLQTPLGSLTVATTHFHARYGTDEYELVQVAQALQAADWLGDHGLHPPRASDTATLPLLLAGDVNCARDSLPFRLLVSRAGLTPVDGDQGIDWVFTRQGGELELRVKQVRRVLDQEVELGDGSQRRLSDHTGRLAVLELRRRRGPLSVQPRSDWRPAADEALGRVDAELAASRERSSQARRSGVLWLLISMGLLGLSTRLKGRGRWVLALAALVLLHLATWRVYLGFVYEPTLQAGLTNARARLQEG